jgi:hypothetical protein
MEASSPAADGCYVSMLKLLGLLCAAALLTCAAELDQVVREVFGRRSCKVPGLSHSSRR